MLVKIPTLLRLVVLAFVIAGATLFIKSDIHNIADLQDVRCGIPLAVISSDQSWRNPPFPYEATCLGSEYGDTSKINLYAFMINIAVYFAVLLTLWVLVQQVLLKQK